MASSRRCSWDLVLPPSSPDPRDDIKTMEVDDLVARTTGLSRDLLFPQGIFHTLDAFDESDQFSDPFGLFRDQKGPGTAGIRTRNVAMAAAFSLSSSSFDSVSSNPESAHVGMNIDGSGGRPISHCRSMGASTSSAPNSGRNLLNVPFSANNIVSDYTSNEDQIRSYLAIKMKELEELIGIHKDCLDNHGERELKILAHNLISHFADIYYIRNLLDKQNFQDNKMFLEGFDLLTRCKARFDLFSSSSSSSGSSSANRSIEDIFGSEIAKELFESCIFTCLAKFKIMQKGRETKNKVLFLGQHLIFIKEFCLLVMPYYNDQEKIRIIYAVIEKIWDVYKADKDAPQENHRVSIRVIVAEKSQTIENLVQLLKTNNNQENLIYIISHLVNILAEMRDIELLHKSVCFVPDWYKVKKQVFEALKRCKKLPDFNALNRKGFRIEDQNSSYDNYERIQSMYSGIKETVGLLIDSYVNDCRSLSFVATTSRSILTKQIFLLDYHFQFVKSLVEVFKPNDDVLGGDLTVVMNTFKTSLNILKNSLKKAPLETS